MALFGGVEFLPVRYKALGRAALVLTLFCMAAVSVSHAAEIQKLGTIDCDLVETSTVVFGGRVWRFEYVRPGYWDNATGDSYFRFVDRETGERTSAFGKGHHLGSAFVDGGQVIVTAVNIWDGERVEVFTSSDMKTWEQWNALNLPGYGIFNTSLCKADGRYVLMFEIGRPAEETGAAFTARFATSDDLKRWKLTPPACNYAKDRYTAPHKLVWRDGWYYNFYLEAIHGGYEQFVVRSRDLITWEQSPRNPVLKASDPDRTLHNPRLPEKLQERIKAAVNLNNSDLDYCEFEGKLIMNYSWGNQQGIEHLAEAIYPGTEAQFLADLFPAK